MKTFTDKLEALRVLFEAECRAELIKGGMPAHMLDDGHYYRARIVTGKKYAKLDFGTSGVYMIVNDTGEIFGIKAYGVIHRGHRFGTLDTISEWNWGGYRASRKPV